MFMDTASATKIKQGLEELHKMDIDNLITSLMPSGQSIDAMILNTDIPVATFLHLYKRSVTQFRAEITRNDIAWSLPLLFPTDMNTVPINGQPQFRPENICTVINSMIDFVLKKNYPNMVNQLKKIIAYQIFCGFFDKSSIKQHTAKGLGLTEKTSRVDAVLQKAANLEQRTEKLLADSAELKKKMKIRQLKRPIRHKR